MSSHRAIFTCCVLVSLAVSAHAQVSYVDATLANTTRVDGNPFLPASTSNVYTDDNWSLRTGYASDGGIFEGGGGEAVPMLKQTVTGVAPGTYDVFVFFWVSNSGRWQINAGLSPGATAVYYGYGQQSLGNLVASPAGSTSYAGSSAFAPGMAPTVTEEADRTMLRARIATVVVTEAGLLEVFVTTGPLGTGGTSSDVNNRSWFDGIGYAPPEPLPGNGVEIAPDGTWTWFNDERSILHQGSLFSGYVTSGGKTGVTRYELTTGEAHHMIISTGASQQKDDHNNPSITVLPDRKLMVLYSKHNATPVFYQRISTVPLPSSDSDWGPEITLSVPAKNTYANTYALSAEPNTIYNFHRCINFNPTVTISTDTGATWQPPRQLLGTGSGSTRPYPRYTSNGVDRIDLIYTDGHPRDVDNSVYHMFYRNGGLHKTDGTLIDSLANIPLDHDAGQRGNTIYPYSAAAWGAGEGPDDWIPTGRGWTWDVHYGQGGNPVCVFQVQVGTDSTWSTSRIYYYYARWTGTGWQRKFFAQGGCGIYAAESDYGGGMCLDPGDPRVVYLSTNAASPFALDDVDNVPLAANQRYEIWRGFTADGGLTFTWNPITANSTADNLRPIVPMHHSHSEFLLWFNGSYNTYTNFSTRILARIGLQQLSFQEWSRVHSIPGTTPTDSDDDGVDDLMEFALGGDPVDSASRPLPIWQDGTFSFPWPRDRAGIDWVVQASEDLTDWQQVAVLRGEGLPMEVGADYSFSSSDGSDRTAMLTPTGLEPARRFLRLKVVVAGNPDA